MEYLLKWKGSGAPEATWEPLVNCGVSWGVWRVSLLIGFSTLYCMQYSMFYSVSTRGGCEATIARYEAASGARRRRGRADEAGAADLEGGPTGPETLRYHMMQTRRSSYWCHVSFFHGFLYD